MEVTSAWTSPSLALWPQATRPNCGSFEKSSVPQSDVRAKVCSASGEKLANAIKDVAQVLGHLARHARHGGKAWLKAEGGFGSFASGLQGLVAVGEDVQQGSVCHEVEAGEILLLLLQIVVPQTRTMWGFNTLWRYCPVAGSVRRHPGHR